MNINVRLEITKKRVQELTKHFPYTAWEINMLTIAYVAMSMLDFEITDLLDEAYSRIFILFNDGSFDKHFWKYDPDSLDYSACYMVPSFDNDRKYNDDFILINECDIHPIRFLFDQLMHELKHALNTIIKGFQKRDGLAFFHCGIGWEEYEGETYWSFLEELFNDYLVQIYLEQIRIMKDMTISDAEIRAILDDFDLPKEYEYSYHSTELLVPLFKNSEYFWLFYNAALYKDYEPFLKGLDEIFKKDLYGNPIEDSYFSVADFLDNLISDYQNKTASKEFCFDVQDYFVRTLKR
ncbi:MAG: hypothetical protein K2J20_06480 [Bacilli bacterium]|nr:hypothetical protein [Bacilli bacterium]